MLQYGLRDAVNAPQTYQIGKDKFHEMAKINLTPPDLSEKQIQRFWKFVDKSLGQGPEGTCWEWKGATDFGYGRFTTSDRPRTFRTNRLAYFLTHTIWSTFFILHHCDNPACCNPAHLFEGNQQMNLDDAKEKGRVPRGEQHWANTQPNRVPKGSKRSQTKLTEDLVIMIREQCEQGVNQAALARELGVHPSLIHRVKKRLNWTHI